MSAIFGASGGHDARRVVFSVGVLAGGGPRVGATDIEGKMLQFCLDLQCHPPLPGRPAARATRPPRSIDAGLMHMANAVAALPRSKQQLHKEAWSQNYGVGL